MIPISDNQPRRRTPIITYSLITLNLLIFLLQLGSGPWVEALVYRWGVVPTQIALWPQQPAVLLTLISSTFLHGGWAHLIGNMLYLGIFGDNVEDRLGHGRFLLFYLGGGIVAGLVQVWFTPGSPVPAIGASGAVATVLGAYMVLYPAARVRVIIPPFFFFGTIAVPAILTLGFWFVGQFFNGLFSLGAMSAAYSGGVAWWAHVGGFVTGMIIAFRLPRPPRPPVPSRPTYVYRTYDYYR
jgi:membrane associated rhomboid family serine protease